MNHLTTLYVNQADREREVADDLRNRQILHGDEHSAADAGRLAANANHKVTTNPRPSPIHARAAGR